MKKIYIITALTSLVLTACDNNTEPPVPSQVVAEISATISNSGQTRASDQSWAANDEIGITVSTGLKSEPFVNLKYTTPDTGGHFEGSTIYIYNPMSVTAYYPYTGEEGTDPGIVSATTDARNQDPANQPNIDFLFASIDDITTDDPQIKLQFSHMMSKLTFTFVNGNDGTEVSKISAYQIDGLILDGSFDTASGKCQADEKASPSPLKILTENVENRKAILPVIIFPQEVATNSVKLTITDSDNQIYVCSLNFDDNKIEEGRSYQYTITVRKTGLTVNPAGITDWTPAPDGAYDADSAE